MKKRSIYQILFHTYHNLLKFSAAAGLALFLLVLGPFLVPVPPLKKRTLVSSLADSDSQFMDVNGINIHFKVAGENHLESDRPAIVLLHGFGASAFSWRAVLSPLGRIAATIAYDRPAFGLTERPLPHEWEHPNPYGPEGQAGLLVQMLDRLHIDRAVLVGNSMGGVVALNTALLFPERVEALVLVDAAVHMTRWGRIPEWLKPTLLSPQARRLGPLLVRGIARR